MFSRQRYVLGDGAMHKLSKANVLIVGLGGVGVEVGKSMIVQKGKLLPVVEITRIDHLIQSIVKFR